jgi:hypothetical protein
MKTNRLVLGKVDYNGSGRRNCEAAITWELRDGRFSMCAEIWNPRHTDCYTCGQCVDTVAAYFPHKAQVQRMLALWREWHLNDMVAGSPAQEAWLKANPLDRHYSNHYDYQCARLAEVGLNPDPDYLHNGEPYKYGHAWLKRELPADVIAEIESWSAVA